MSQSRQNVPYITRLGFGTGKLRIDLAVRCFVLLLLFTVFCQFVYSAQQLLPKREAPKRPQSAKISRNDYTDTRISKGSLIQQVSYDEEPLTQRRSASEIDYHAIESEDDGDEKIATVFPELDYPEYDESAQDELAQPQLPDQVGNYDLPELNSENTPEKEQNSNNVSENQKWAILVSPKPASPNPAASPEMFTPYQRQYQYNQQNSQNPTIAANYYGYYNQQPVNQQPNYQGYTNSQYQQNIQAGYTGNQQTYPYYGWPAPSIPNPYAYPYPYPHPYYYYPNAQAQSGYWGYPQQYPSGYRTQKRPNQFEADDEEPGFSETFLETLSYFNPLNSPKGPNRGVGGPLVMRSWLDRPFYIGVFAGAMDGDQLVNNLLNQDCGATGGLSLGWNCDNYWGLESRLFFSSLSVKDTEYAIQKHEEQFSPDTYLRPLTTRNNSMTTFDVSVHYYPLGNAKWRPFMKLGIGLSSQKFRDIDGTEFSVNTCVIPVGVGVKYWWNERVALQLDLVDNIYCAADGTKTQNNWTVTVGLNFPLGKIKRKNPTVYWPTVPSSSR